MKRMVLVFVVFCVGCGAEQIVDKQFIHGTWLGADGREAVSFFSDGTMRIALPFGVKEGKYEVMSDNRMKLTTPGMMWGQNDEIVDYEVTTKTLKIKSQIFGVKVEGTLKRK